ncbi:MAG: hypothetical protein DA407_11540 [Bacteroidetes bacterium]|nr:MAG: hypothetical protein DA407_11540 [Bacteroidota bacterium]
MDELEILKKDWQKEDNTFPKLTYNEIYKMILKKSSSIVKWIFIISILEFVLWAVISFALKDADYNQRFKEYNAENIMIPFIILGYVIIASFLYRFFMNYRTISVTDNAKVLMENILKTRRTVKYYVAVNLGVMIVSAILVLGIQFNRDEQIISVIEKASANGELFKFYAVTIIITLLVLAALIGVMLLFYYLIYGILLKRLNKNYRELKKLEV